MATETISRRDFLHLLWGTAGAVALTEMSLVGLRFLAPRPVVGEFGGVFNVGVVDDFPLGSVTPVEAGRFYVVRLPDGGLLAVYRRCTHLGCAVPYDPSVGQFVCPCHGSAFTMDGAVLNAPAPRPLDLFALTLNEVGEILVDTQTSIQRDQISPEHVVYPVVG
ncbi:MAG: Rieske 2Fe-2S domain-containing protein [Chloroflexi bacterium]|nr:Rieske 2Fe-2S domain-containing protein [Chloroflexota bacterium]MBP8058097.1 Rieske 2Fe-2S domain-containing protein [Chloroflexota bacterium]